MKNKHKYLHENITCLWVNQRFKVRVWWDAKFRPHWPLFGARRVTMKRIAKRFVEIEGVNAVEVTDPRDDDGVLIYKDWP